MHDVIEAHLDHLRESRYSASTLRERERVLRTLPGDPLALDRETTQAWWHDRQALPDGRPRSAASLSQEASHRHPISRNSGHKLVPLMATRFAAPRKVLVPPDLLSQ